MNYTFRYTMTAHNDILEIQFPTTKRESKLKTKFFLCAHTCNVKQNAELKYEMSTCSRMRVYSSKCSAFTSNTFTYGQWVVVWLPQAQTEEAKKNMQPPELFSSKRENQKIIHSGVLFVPAFHAYTDHAHHVSFISHSIAHSNKINYILSRSLPHTCTI